jgi:AcrR family transcriptional regulator
MARCTGTLPRCANATAPAVSIDVDRALGNTMSTPLAQHEISPPGMSSVRRHERVLDEAARQLNAKGVSLTSLTEIAEKLGISRAAMYYYVEDREDLVFQCYRRSCEITARYLNEATREPGTAVEMITRFVHRMLDPNEPELAARAEIAMMTQPQRDTIQGLYDAIASRVAHLLTTGQHEGLIRACDVEVNARIILSLVTWAPLARPWAHGAVSHESMVAAVIATIFEGFAREASAPSYVQFDLSSLSMRTGAVFDRDAISEAKRETLVSVASRLFNRKGIDSTSLEEIAAQVGATKRTLHRHLGSKQELVGACYERAFKIFLHIKDSMLEHPGSRLSAIASAMYAVAIAYPREDLSPLSPLVGFGALSEAAQAKFKLDSAALSSGYYETLRKGIAEGSIAAVDVEARALVLPGLLSWLVKEDVPTDETRRKFLAGEIAQLVAIGLRQG